jgi:hypothetical protein
VRWPVLNLRYDLAGLSDDELAERLKAAWLAYETAETQSFRWKGYGTLWYSARGLIRHPLAYPFVSVFAVKGPFPTFWFGSAIGLFFTPVRKMHLSLCEIRRHRR